LLRACEPHKGRIENYQTFWNGSIFFKGFLKK